MKYLGALFGDVTPEEAYEKSSLSLRAVVCTFHECPSPLRNGSSWCTLGATQLCRSRGVAFYPPLSILIRLRAAMRVAFGARN